MYLWRILSKLTLAGIAVIRDVILLPLFQHGPVLSNLLSSLLQKRGRLSKHQTKTSWHLTRYVNIHAFIGSESLPWLARVFFPNKTGYGHLLSSNLLTLWSRLHVGQLMTLLAKACGQLPNVICFSGVQINLTGTFYSPLHHTRYCRLPRKVRATLKLSAL